jgi:hypothetical protein
MPLEWEPAYRAERDKLIDGEQDYYKSYDKYVLTLSGGALALSLTFIHDIIGTGPVRFPALVVLAWLSFTLSVAAALVSIQQSGPLYRRFRDILDKHAENAGPDFRWAPVRKEQGKCRRLILMNFLNYGSLVLFLLGVILLLSFTGCNLRGGRAMEQDSPELHQPIGQLERFGAKPALAPPDTTQPAPEGRAGKPPLAPVDLAPPAPPPTPPPAAPSQPAPSQPTGGQS